MLSVADALRRELARGTVELAVLSALARARRYGYELLTLLDRASGGVVEIREGTLYPLLHRLEDAGHVRSTWEVEGRARPRKYYQITQSGRARAAALREEWAGVVRDMQRLLKTLDQMERE